MCNAAPSLAAARFYLSRLNVKLGRSPTSAVAAPMLGVDGRQSRSVVEHVDGLRAASILPNFSGRRTEPLEARAVLPPPPKLQA